MTKISVGIIGLGRIAQTRHLPNASARDDVVISAVCDIDEARAAAVRRKFYADSTWATYGELIGSGRVEALIVATHDHYDIVAAGLSAGLHVFVEKPLAWTLDQARSLRELARAKKRVLQVGYMKYYDPAYLEMKRWLSTRDLLVVEIRNRGGNLRRAHKALGTRLEPLGSARHKDNIENETLATIGPDKSTALRFALELLSHDLDLLIDSLGMPTSILFAHLTNDRNSARGPSLIKAAAASMIGLHALLKYDGGAVVHVHSQAHFDGPLFWDESIRAYSKTEIAQLDFPFPFGVPATGRLRIARGGEDEASEVHTSFEPLCDPFQAELDSFFSAVRTGRLDEGRLNAAVDVIKLASHLVTAADNYSGLPIRIL